MEHLSQLWILVKYITLGAIQGFTEPIPISSSGHLIIFRKLFGIQIEGLSFEILVNSASLIAVLIIYRADILRLIKGFFSYLGTRERAAKADFNFVIYLVLATIPTGILGFLLEDFIGARLAGVTIVGATLLVTGVALWVIRNLRGRKQDGDMSAKYALIIGLAQSVALIPGISRSGATIVAAILLGMKQETALRFSFLLYIPVSFGVMILSIGDMVSDPNFSMLAIPYLLAFIASLIASFYALRWFMNIMARGNLRYFAYYCFIAGILVILFL